MRKNVGEQKKYEFTGETMEFEGHILKRIRYLKETDFVEKGSLGGWIESENNLSHEGNCAIRDDAKVLGYARVMEEVVVGDDAIVKDNALVFGDCYIGEESIVGADTIISGETQIYGESKVFFYADEQYGRPNISGDSRIDDCTIEATGRIVDSCIRKEELFGDLKIINKEYIA